MTVPASSANLAQQAKDYMSVVKACLAVSRCVGIVRTTVQSLCYNFLIFRPDDVGYHGFVLVGTGNIRW